MRTRWKVSVTWYEGSDLGSSWAVESYLDERRQTCVTAQVDDQDDVHVALRMAAAAILEMAHPRLFPL
jgi:hypothetical protein